MSWRSVAAVVVLCAGGGLCVVATLGVVVMRDWQDRVHYVGLASIGAALVGISIAIRESLSLIGDKALLTAAILLFAGPVLVHTTLRSGRIHVLGDWRRDVDDEVER